MKLLLVLDCDPHKYNIFSVYVTDFYGTCISADKILAAMKPTSFGNQSSFFSLRFTNILQGNTYNIRIIQGRFKAYAT